VALVVTGQLLPFEEAAPATLNPGELDAAHKQLAPDPVLSAAFGLTPAAPEARILQWQTAGSVRSAVVAVGWRRVSACCCVCWGGWPPSLVCRARVQLEWPAL
jgi:hypothetical protein